MTGFKLYEIILILQSIAIFLSLQDTVVAFTPNTFSQPQTAVSTLTVIHGKTSSTSEEVADYDEQIQSCTQILNKTVKTQAEDPEVVLQALETLEKVMRSKRKTDTSFTVAKDILENLNGSWRLVFTTGTKQTQDRFETKINYFPIKAVQSFDTSGGEPFKIENGIYAGDFALLKFGGEFEFDMKKSKLEFNFDQITILQLPTINLKKDDAAKIGASTGLGSKSNVKNAQKDKKAFFNWISCDKNIATARGGGGGLALWKRIE